jgi:hypothetical protein
LLSLSVSYVAGNGEYTAPEDDATWPIQPNIWFFNSTVGYSTGFVLFCIFVEGLLKVCDVLSNPHSTEALSFSERAYGKLVINYLLLLDW